MNMASSLRVAKFVAATLAMLAIAGCAKQVGETALASAAIPDSQQDSASTPAIAFSSTPIPRSSPIRRARRSTIAAILARSRAVMAA